MKAWRTRCIGVESIVAAESRAKARYQTVKGANAAGWEVPFTHPVSVKRAPEYDEWAQQEHAPGKCWGEEFVK